MHLWKVHDFNETNSFICPTDNNLMRWERES